MCCCPTKLLQLQLPHWTMNRNIRIMIAQNNLLIVVASKQNTNRDCRRTETLLNLGQMNGSSTD